MRQQGRRPRKTLKVGRFANVPERYGHGGTLQCQEAPYIWVWRHLALPKSPPYLGMGTQLPSHVRLAVVSGVNHYVHCARDGPASALRLAPPTPSHGHCPCSAAAATSPGAGPRPPVLRPPVGGGGVVPLGCGLGVSPGSSLVSPRGAGVS